MTGLHQKFLLKNGFYAKWHQNPGRDFYHWFFFVLFSVVVSALLLIDITFDFTTSFGSSVNKTLSGPSSSLASVVIGPDLSFPTQGKSGPEKILDNYYLLLLTGDKKGIAIYKSPKNPADWMPLSQAAHTFEQPVQAMTYIVVGSNIHVVTHESSGALSYHVFSATTDSWTIFMEPIATVSVAADKQYGLALGMWSDGSIPLIVGATSPMSMYERKPGAGWSNLGGIGGAVDYAVPDGVIYNGNTFTWYFATPYFSPFYFEQGRGDFGAYTWVHSPLSVGSEHGNVSFSTEVYYPTNAVKYRVGEETRSTSAHITETGAMGRMVHKLDGSNKPPFFMEYGITANIPHSTGTPFKRTVASLASLGEYVWLIYASAGGTELRSTRNIADAGWAQDIKLLDATDIQQISAKILDRKMLIIYNDAGVIKIAYSQ
ncbi:MAG: hypothetical protein HY506_01570 [Candidatus Yanofskybacteria bacterium]|nr:hypothetical protein [Candidatus Yanofskybacteria bacterium]